MKNCPPFQPPKGWRPPERDSRINTPLISFRIYLTVFSIIYFLTIGQAFILSVWLGQTLTLMGILAYYMLSTGLFITILAEICRRYFFGKPLQKIAKAARQITSGDFSVRVESTRKDGKKDEIEVLIEDFNTMAEELGSVELLKNDFIADVSHEIKSPLAVVQSYAQMLKAPELSPEERNEYADVIVSAAQNLSSMVTSILKLNKLENQEIYSVPKPYQLGEQLRQCALLYMDKWQEKEIDFQIDVEDRIVCYDADLLEIVWNNLISNAVKFTPIGGEIRLSSRYEGDWILVCIRDSGSGIDAKTFPMLFEKFYQGDSSRSIEGNGLGLALVKKVLQITEGEIAVENVPEAGAQFTVKLKSNI